MKTQWLSRVIIKTFSIGCLALAGTAASQLASAHGTITSPESRIWNCKEQGQNPSSAACAAAIAESGTQQIYDWNGIRQGAADGQHETVVPDGQLCSGGDPGTFGGMDLARTDWEATPVAGSQTFTWYNSAPHKSLYYRYYITKSSYDPSQPLTWDDLEYLMETDPKPGETYPSHTVSLPNRSGKHVVYAVWQRSDSPEAFYACVDVVFNGDGGGNDGGGNDGGGDDGGNDGGGNDDSNVCVGIPNWNSNGVYTQGDQVRYNDNRYEAKWWTQGQAPADHSSEWAVWIDQGACSQ